MRGKQLTGVLAAVLAATLVGGCGADGDAPQSATSPTEADGDTPQPVASASAAVEPMQDEAICTAYGDVLTIVENADLGVRDGRMETQEQQGWYQLATRVLDRLPSSGDGAVRHAIADLQDVAPAVPSGASGPSGIKSPEWTSAQEALYDACLDAGVTLTIEVFTGG